MTMVVLMMGDYADGGGGDDGNDDACFKCSVRWLDCDGFWSCRWLRLDKLHRLVIVLEHCRCLPIVRAYIKTQVQIESPTK